MIDTLHLLAPGPCVPLPPDPVETIDDENEAAYWARIETLATAVEDRGLLWRFEMIASGEVDANHGWCPDEGRPGPFGQDDYDAFTDLDGMGLVVYRGLELTADGEAVATVLAERARR